MCSNAKIVKAWSEFIGSGVSYFTTLTFNWKGWVSKRCAHNALRELSYQLDRIRLGGRFYQRGAPDRTIFLLVPEKIDSYAHYHGVVLTPNDKGARCPQEDFPRFLKETWKGIVPGGTIDVQPHEDAGALFYATKETHINNDDVVCSFDFWGSPNQQ